MILKKLNAEGNPKLLYLSSDHTPEEEKDVCRLIIQSSSDEALNDLLYTIIRSGVEAYGLAYANYRSAKLIPYTSDRRRKAALSRAKSELKKERDFFLYSNLMMHVDIDPVELMKKIESEQREKQRYLKGEKVNAGNQSRNQSR